MTTLEQERERIHEALDDGTTCGACGQHAQKYRRPITSAMAYSLIRLHRYGREWAHLPTVLASKGGDDTKLRYWGLIEQDRSRLGYWRITDLGVSFVLGLATVPSYAFVFDGGLEGLSTERTNIVETLTTKFDYDSLMGASAV